MRPMRRLWLVVRTVPIAIILVVLFGYVIWAMYLAAR